RAPWQNPFAERVIGSIRRECLDHVIVLNERHLRRLLHRYLAYHNATRRISPSNDSPIDARCKPQLAGASLRSRRSADFITAISARPECRGSQRSPTTVLRDGGRPVVLCRPSVFLTRPFSAARGPKARSSPRH